MDKRRKTLLKQAFNVMFTGDIEDILSKKVTDSESVTHIILPKKYKGKKAKVIIYS